MLIINTPVVKIVREYFFKYNYQFKQIKQVINTFAESNLR